jgi:hypothetical protein
MLHTLLCTQVMDEITQTQIASKQYYELIIKRQWRHPLSLDRARSLCNSLWVQTLFQIMIFIAKINILMLLLSDELPSFLQIHINFLPLFFSRSQLIFDVINGRSELISSHSLSKNKRTIFEYCLKQAVAHMHWEPLRWENAQNFHLRHSHFIFIIICTASLFHSSRFINYERFVDRSSSRN